MNDKVATIQAAPRELLIKGGPMSDLVYVSGQRGKSKTDVKVSVNTVLGCVAIHVWEDGKITHTFYPNLEFARAMVVNAQAYINQQEELERKESQSKG